MTTEYQQAAFDLLHQFAHKRPGLEFAMYGDVTAYRSDQRRNTEALHDFQELYSKAHWRSFTCEEIREAFKRAFSGRLELIEKGGMPHALHYCAGQYAPTEFRFACCAVLASLLWAAKRDDMAERIGEYGFGDELRAAFKREFSRRVCRGYFN